jgi:hypothetical protein
VKWSVRNLAALAAAMLPLPAQAQLTTGFYSENCPERTSARWCPSQLSQAGWTLKYNSSSPADLMDAYWRYEIWIRERAAVVCVLIGGRGGERVNTCQALSEVQ